jgi:GH25 family lysozyme M1 (1,4-beta-N-acetylmuramidase)
VSFLKVTPTREFGLRSVSLQVVVVIVVTTTTTQQQHNNSNHNKNNNNSKINKIPRLQKHRKTSRLHFVLSHAKACMRDFV